MVGYKLNRQQKTKDMIILFALLIPVVIWLALKFADCYDDGLNLFEIMEQFTAAMNEPLKISFNQYSLKFTVVFIFLYAMSIGMYFSQQENSRPGEEHGSAKWGNVHSVARKYADKKDRFHNLILSQNLALNINAKAHRRNLNVLVVGGSGAGKTRFYAKPSASVRVA